MNKDEYLFILHATRTELVIPLDDKVHQDMNGIDKNELVFRNPVRLQL
jgi:hypothetical protein